MGRVTQGVTLINVDEGTELSGLQRIAEGDDDSELDDESDESVDNQAAEGEEPESNV
jgi:DNA gyrase subunit A